MSTLFPNSSQQAHLVKFAARFCGVSSLGIVAATGELGLRGDKSHITEVNSILRCLARASNREAELLGSSPIEKAQVAQWMSFASGRIAGTHSVNGNSTFAILEDALLSKAYLSANRVTLADVAVFWLVYSELKKISKIQRSQYRNMVRWFDQIQHTIGVRGYSEIELLQLDTQTPTTMPVICPSAICEPTVLRQQPVKDASKVGTKAQRLAAAAEQDKDKKNSKGEKDKNGKAGEKVVSAPSSAIVDICSLDIRVGRIVKCWAHEDSSKLFCEEVDVGENSPRQIASGLREFYSSSAKLEGKRVLVLCNLKPRTMAGFKSNGMILCASSVAGEKRVELLEPPVDAPVGSRVIARGVKVREPSTPLQMGKKKIFETVQPKFSTSADRVPMWDGKVLVVDDKQCSVQTIANGSIS